MTERPDDDTLEYLSFIYGNNELDDEIFGAVFPLWFVNKIVQVHKHFDVFDPEHGAYVGQFFSHHPAGKHDVAHSAKSLDPSLVRVLEMKYANVIGYLFSNVRTERIMALRTIAWGLIFERKIVRASQFVKQLIEEEADESHIALHLLSAVEFMSKQYKKAARTITLCMNKAPPTLVIPPSTSSYFTALRERFLGTGVFNKTDGMKIIHTTRGFDRPTQTPSNSEVKSLVFQVFVRGGIGFESSKEHTQKQSLYKMFPQQAQLKLGLLP